MGRRGRVEPDADADPAGGGSSSRRAAADMSIRGEPVAVTHGPVFRVAEVRSVPMWAQGFRGSRANLMGCIRSHWAVPYKA